MDDEKHPEAVMGGAGISLRPRPSRHFAFDIGFDFLSGIDYHGNPRNEAGLSFNPMLFFNPRDTLQIYMLAGLGLSGAAVDLPDGSFARYSYFGLNGGLGFEFRVSRELALDLDLVGFVRGRVDRDADFYPEFFDIETGRSSNTSSGALGRLGAVFYW